MQKNLLRYLAASPLHPREEYVTLRRDLALLLHDLHQLATDPDADTASALEALRGRTEALDLAGNGTIDSLMRERRIGSEQASSLMNDSTYASSIASNLTKMAQVLFAAGPAPHPLEQDLRRDGEETDPKTTDVTAPGPQETAP